MDCTLKIVICLFPSGGDARVRTDFQVWTVGTRLNVLNDAPPKYDELFPAKIAADDKEHKEGGFGVQHI